MRPEGVVVPAPAIGEGLRLSAEAAREEGAPAAEQAALNKKAGSAAAKARASIDHAIAAAEMAGVEVDRKPLAADAIPRRGLARKADGTTTAKTQRNFSDPERHLMQSGGIFLQGYNCQVAVDSDHQVIVAVGFSNRAPDVEHHEPMVVQRIASHAGARPDVMTLNAGFWSEDNARTCAKEGIDAYKRFA